MCTHCKHNGFTDKSNIGEEVVTRTPKANGLTGNLGGAQYLLAGGCIFEVCCTTRCESCTRRTQALQYRTSIDVECDNGRLIRILLESRHQTTFPEVLLEKFILRLRKLFINKGEIVAVQ